LCQLIPLFLNPLIFIADEHSEATNFDIDLECHLQVPALATDNLHKLITLIRSCHKFDVERHVAPLKPHTLQDFRVVTDGDLMSYLLLKMLVSKDLTTTHYLNPCPQSSHRGVVPVVPEGSITSAPGSVEKKLFSHPSNGASHTLRTFLDLMIRSADCGTSRAAMSKVIISRFSYQWLAIWLMAIRRSAGTLFAAGPKPAV